MKQKKNEGRFLLFMYHVARYGLCVFAAGMVIYTAVLVGIGLVRDELVLWQAICDGVLTAFYHAALLSGFYMALYLVANAVELWFLAGDAIWRIKQKRKERKNRNAHIS